MISTNHITKSEDETIALGMEFAKLLKVGDIVALFGDVGAGKTEFVKGVCQFFNVEEFVSSPTFTIINQYKGMLKDKKLTLYHIDLYRVDNKVELAEIGFEECIYSNNCIKLVEWAEKADEIIPNTSYSVQIKNSLSDEDERYITIQQN